MGAKGEIESKKLALYRSEERLEGYESMEGRQTKGYEPMEGRTLRGYEPMEGRMLKRYEPKEGRKEGC
ncbi:hypothetical protein PPACK8108_LOCUS19392 [Phakopsora pachyrhizi]|uniref:Uncharacterized protein n=1 Tax=Phakopsora pachyrhizi TaxID=170000 RepID=A0AAV0BEV3_PHAPC|nr:hypothetical protein PPACK8108_LOCUS19392 [Phakopsora pachyrhizi]